MTKEGEPSSNEVMIIEDDECQITDVVIKNPRVRPRFIMGNQRSTQLAPGGAREPRTVSTQPPIVPKSPPSQPGSRSPPPRLDSTSSAAAAAGSSAPAVTAQGSAVREGSGAQIVAAAAKSSAPAVTAQGSAAAVNSGASKESAQTVVSVPNPLPILSADTVKPDPIGEQAGLSRQAASSAVAGTVQPPPTPTAVVSHPRTSTPPAPVAPPVVPLASTSTASGTVATTAPTPATIPDALPSTSAATGAEKASGSASPVSEFDEERFTSQLTIRDPDAPLPPGYEEDVPYDEEEEVEDDEMEEGEDEEDPYVEVEEHLAAMEEGADKVRLQKLLGVLRACDERIRALEEADFDVGDEQALYDNEKEVAQWRKRSEMCLNEAIKIMGLEETDDTADSDYEPSAMKMKPFSYSGSGLHYLDQCLTLLVRRVLEKEAAFREDKRAGRDADMVTKDYSEGHIAEMMRQMAASKGLPHLKHEVTHRQLAVADVFPAFHAAVKKYRGKMFRKTVLPKFIYNFGDLELPKNAALDAKLKANESEMGFLEKFAEDFENRKKQEGQVVERDESNPYAIKPDMSNDADDLLDDDEDEENAESDVDMEDCLDAVSTTTEEPDGDKKTQPHQTVPKVTAPRKAVDSTGGRSIKQKSESKEAERSQPHPGVTKETATVTMVGSDKAVPTSSQAVDSATASGSSRMKQKSVPKETSEASGATQPPPVVAKVTATVPLVDGSKEVPTPSQEADSATSSGSSKRKSDSENEASEGNSSLKRSRSEVLTDELRDLHVDAEISLDEDWPDGKSEPPDDDDNDDYPDDINNLLEND